MELPGLLKVVPAMDPCRQHRSRVVAYGLFIYLLACLLRTATTLRSLKWRPPFQLYPFQHWEMALSELLIKGENQAHVPTC